jgi:hypothetical protein
MQNRKGGDINMQEEVIQLVFRNEADSLFTISLPNPQAGLTEAAVASVMDEIIAKNIFHTAGGAVVSKVRARLVAREVTEIASFM